MSDPNEEEKRQRVKDGSWLQDWPGRPDTPEYWQLSELVLQMDADGNSKPMEEIIPTDLPSLVYQAEQRFGLFTQRLGLPDDVITRTLFVAGYTEAFVLGHRYSENPPGPGWKPAKPTE